jgi:hypothetical protein
METAVSGENQRPASSHWQTLSHNNTKPTCTYILGIHDIDYQNSSDTVGSSWHGFSDRDSGITHYMWCVQTQSSNQPCNIRDWAILQIPWKKVKSYANTPTWSKNSANSQCKAWICEKYHGY